MWTEPHTPSPDELYVLTAFAAQVAQALLRVQEAATRARTAAVVAELSRALQQALLTPPPEPDLDHLHIAVRYLPAADTAQIATTSPTPPWVWSPDLAPPGA